MAKEKKPPPQEQDLPGSEQEMDPKPVSDDPDYKATGQLKDKIAIITGGDSGIGKAVAVLFAKEGAKIAIVYLNEHEDANETKELVEKYGSEILLIPGDIADENFCKEAVKKTAEHYGRIDILVNNAAEQHEAETLDDLETKNLVRTFQVNIFLPCFILQKPHCLL